jgi:hypothetical protein
MTDFAERRKPPAPRKEEPLDLLRNRGGIEGPLSTIAEFVEFVRKTSEEWQTADIKDLESDEDSFFNDARIVGQVWFRGQGSCRLNLMPGLYREETWRHLRKAKPGDEEQFEALYWIEHELRIDFESYGQLLNESSQAKTAIDWYFLMQHYRVPTRLLDWTTNALAALFFAIDRHSPYSPYFRAPSVNDSENPSGQLQVAVWMVDAFGWRGTSVRKNGIRPSSHTRRTRPGTCRGSTN